MLTLTRPDDWHLHLRDGGALRAVLPATTRCFARAMVMPNLHPPIVTTDQAIAYRNRILAAVPKNDRFEPLLTLYLTEHTTADEIRAAKASGIIYGVKYYPAGATTHSAAGVSDFRKVYVALAEMEKLALPLLVHGEIVDTAVDIFDREKIFIDRVLTHIQRDFPQLRMVFEHATTKEAVAFVLATPTHIGATITPQHLLFNRNALLSDGLRPHFYCKPVLQRESHREALLQAATSGNSKFFLGTDSAPHAKQTKESDCGCAGCYSAPAAIELYAQAFEAAGALDKLEGFASFYGADFYGLPRNLDSITLLREQWILPSTLAFADQSIVPFCAGELLTWRLKTISPI